MSSQDSATTSDFQEITTPRDGVVERPKGGRTVKSGSAILIEPEKSAQKPSRFVKAQHILDRVERLINDRQRRAGQIIEDDAEVVFDVAIHLLDKIARDTGTPTNAAEWVKQWLPIITCYDNALEWIAEREAEARSSRHWPSSHEIAKALMVRQDEIDALDLRGLVAHDVTDEERKARKRERERLKKERQRRNKGVRPQSARAAVAQAKRDEAAALGVTARTVSNWMKKATQGGHDLERVVVGEGTRLGKEGDTSWKNGPAKLSTSCPVTQDNKGVGGHELEKLVDVVPATLMPPTRKPFSPDDLPKLTHIRLRGLTITQIVTANPCVADPVAAIVELDLKARRIPEGEQRDWLKGEFAKLNEAARAKASA